MSIENIFALCLAFFGGIILRTLVLNLLSTREQEQITKEIIQHACFMVSLLLIHSHEMRKIVKEQLCDHLSDHEVEGFFHEVERNIVSQHLMLRTSISSFMGSKSIKDLEKAGFFELINSCSDIYEKGPVEYLVEKYAPEE